MTVYVIYVDYDYDGCGTPLGIFANEADAKRYCAEKNKDSVGVYEYTPLNIHDTFVKEFD